MFHPFQEEQFINIMNPLSLSSSSPSLKASKEEDLEMRGVSVYHLNTTFRNDAYNYKGYDDKGQGTNKKIYQLEDLDKVSETMFHPFQEEQFINIMSPLSLSSSSPSLKASKEEDLEMRGVSVYHLNTTFRNDAYNYKGYDDKGQGTNKKIYQLEDLDKEPGFIRLKGGIDNICPRDGKPGAAYVDCLEGEEHVGRANAMLSYSWGNTVDEIADVTSMYCTKNNLDPKQTYVWICCLCINQHRVAEDRKNGKDIPFKTFQDTFQSRVQGIKNIICLLSPWDEAIYLTRVWCIFEFYTAQMTIDCNVFIEMPKDTRNNFKAYLFSEEEPLKFGQAIFSVLGKTSIENAHASVPADKKNIMRWIGEGLPSGVLAVNKNVNTHLRRWVYDFLKAAYYDIKKNFEQKTQGNEVLEDKDTLQYHHGLYNLTWFFTYNGDNIALAHEIATWWHEELCLKHFGEDHVRTGDSFGILGAIYEKKENFDKAIEFRKKALAIAEKVHGTNHEKTGGSYYNLGQTYCQNNNLDEAMEYYIKALQICEDQLGPEDETTAITYSGIAAVHQQKNELEKALSFNIKAMNILEKLAQSNEGIKATLAIIYHNIGYVYGDLGDIEKQLEYYLKDLDISEKILGADHENTKITYGNISETYRQMGDFDKADEYHVKCFLKASLENGFRNDIPADLLK